MVIWKQWHHVLLIESFYRPHIYSLCPVLRSAKAFLFHVRLFKALMGWKAA